MFILKVFLTIVFMIAGGAKLMKYKPLKEQFDEFGLKGNYILLVGILEIVGAIGLQISLVSIYAAIGLFLTTLGALFNHFKVRHPFTSYLPAMVLGSGLLWFIISMI